MRDPRKLTYTWSKRERDYLIHYPRSCDGHLIHDAMRDLMPELERRGYDTRTVRFEVRLRDLEAKP